MPIKSHLLNGILILIKQPGLLLLIRLKRLYLGNFGNCKILKGASGICELVIDYGPGIRIYFGKESKDIIVLLLAGDKGSQDKDITKAQAYWLDYKESTQ